MADFTGTLTSSTPTAGTTMKVGSGSDTLVLKITQDAYKGDAQYAVYVDGKQIGGTFTAKALHNSGQSDTLEIKGDWGVGNHTVGVKLLNDLYDGTPTTDRNVYVENATYNGSAVNGSYQYVNSVNTKSFAIADSTAVPTGGTTSPAPTPAPTTPTQPGSGVKLTKTTAAIKSSYAGQVIENLDVWVDSGNAISITHDNVIVRNVRIHHKTGDGINVTNAKGVQISNAEIINSDPPKGQNGESSSDYNSIEGFNAANLKIDHVTMRDGASGIYIQNSPNATITNIEGYNFHGPFPRGQLVQIASNSDNSKVSGFYVYNDLYNSRTEDVINIYHSNNVTVENGLIDGCNSPTGAAVLYEGDSGGGIVRNVDVIRYSNGAFSAYSNDVDFFDVRAFDGYNTDIGRGKAASNGLTFNHSGTGVIFDDATYTRPANAGNISWGSRTAELKDISSAPSAAAMDKAQFVHDWNWIA
jgi:hypothetical protein